MSQVIMYLVEKFYHNRSLQVNQHTSLEKPLLIPLLFLHSYIYSSLFIHRLYLNVFLHCAHL